MIDITEDGDDANNFGERIGPTRSTFDNGVEIIVPCVDRNINNFSTVPADKSAPNKLTTQATIGERTRHSRRPKTRNSKLSDAALGFMEYAQKGVVDNIQIASSDVAAICGLNKYARPGELLFKYVYKGFPNLMKMDAANLDISIISEEQKVEELMAQTSQAKELKSVLKASKARHKYHTVSANQDGKKVKSVADVEIFGKQASKAIQTALVKKELPVHEIHELQRAINSSLFTNFGNRKENTALQEYEDRTGYFVSENNAQCYMMSVDTTADDTTADGVMDTADDIQFIPRTNKRAKSFDIIGFIDGIALAPAVEIANPASASSSHETTGSGKPTNEARDSKPQKRRVEL
ncbi:hypothetical protein SARC_00463 [Sphaeroforma arctica JP610]|uniref:Uncharacterized protein n=1 Tax=Sphaeroforma arctica JP610 TaxID=667725 RepID=A0A0L0GEY2_9EUKA|nr:hypothetical protein SARC_00463 [Sphaeroforma arctica JP610]KNC87426.1 hypothetical protein SARC_00463 [Sphaeroforma arctica JP610]|eukprot:XP_014161328.1 hypothetical protein SARC_00463 [Sphaeroforma arctica JP610]